MTNNTHITTLIDSGSIELAFQLIEGQKINYDFSEWIELAKVCNVEHGNTTEGIKKLQGLESLDLRNNQLTSIPESIGKLQGLKYLYLDKSAKL